VDDEDALVVAVRLDVGRQGKMHENLLKLIVEILEHGPEG